MKVNKIFKISIVAFLISTLLISCSGPEESATKGDFILAVDESFEPLMALETEAYGYSYTKVKIKLHPTSEGKAIEQLLNDSARMIVINRELDTIEKQAFTKTNIKYRSAIIGIDGVAIIANKENPDSLISLSDLKEILDGKIKTWTELNAGGLPDSIIIVFDNGNSSNLSFINKKLKIKEGPAKVFAAGSNKKVIDYIKGHKGALGIIGLGWISDKDSPLSMELKKDLKIMWVGADSVNDTIEYFLPTQSALATKKYPFIRDLFCIIKEPGTGPATGFLNYMRSDIGQRIVLKSGVLPIIMPPRRLKIK